MVPRIGTLEPLSGGRATPESREFLLSRGSLLMRAHGERFKPGTLIEVPENGPHVITAWDYYASEVALCPLKDFTQKVDNVD